jgi:hypothetical protein
MLRSIELISKRSLIKLGTLVFLTSCCTNALALQPLRDFLVSSQASNLDAREASATASQREQEAEQAKYRYAPTLTARAAYSRNEYNAQATMGPGQSVTITPYNQLDATAQLSNRAKIS